MNFSSTGNGLTIMLFKKQPLSLSMTLSETDLVADMNNMIIIRGKIIIS